jgi:hypothetical protein
MALHIPLLVVLPSCLAQREATHNSLPVSHKTARQLRRQEKQQKKKEQYRQEQQLGLELLPIELCLMILERLPSYEDLQSLTEASRAYCRTYHSQFKKTILSKIVLTMLGEAFPEACMLQHWLVHRSMHSIGKY